MAGYLSEHHDVLLSKHKEPHYFATDYKCPIVRQVYTEDDYRDQFLGEGKFYKAIGEASTGYIYSSEAVSNILNYNDEAKFIVVVRNPIDMVVSEHAQMLRSGNEDVEDFEIAWNLSDKRKAGFAFPKNRTESYLVIYKEFGRIGTRLRNVVDKVDRQKLKIILFDDFVNSPRKVYVDLLDFLDLPDDGRTDFMRRNERRYHRFRSVKEFVNNPPKSLLNLSHGIKKLTGIDRIGAISKLREWNLIRKDVVLSNDILSDMQEEFKSEVMAVEDILQKKVPWEPWR